MLHVKSYNVKPNSESLFRYFGSAVNSNQSTKCDRKDLHAICRYLKPPKSRLCSSVHLSQIVVWYAATGLYITLHSSSARLDGIHPVQIHLIGIRDLPDLSCVCYKEVKFIPGSLYNNYSPKWRWLFVDFKELRSSEVTIHD